MIDQPNLHDFILTHSASPKTNTILVCCTYNFQQSWVVPKSHVSYGFSIIYIYNLVVCNNSTHHNSFFGYRCEVTVSCLITH